MPQGFRLIAAWICWPGLRVPAITAQGVVRLN